MKAALHDAIKEQGSFQKWFKDKGGAEAFVFTGLIQGNQGKPFTTDLRSGVSSSSTITAPNWPQLIILVRMKEKG